MRADGDLTVVVDLERGGGDLPAIVSSAPFAVVPPSVGDGEIIARPRGASSAAAATPSSASTRTLWTLKANPDYWAGKPAIETVRMLTTLNGQSPVDAFVAGTLDVTPDQLQRCRLDRLRPDARPVAPQRPVARR